MIDRVDCRCMSWVVPLVRAAQDDVGWMDGWKRTYLGMSRETLEQTSKGSSGVRHVNINIAGNRPPPQSSLPLLTSAALLEHCPGTYLPCWPATLLLTFVRRPTTSSLDRHIAPLSFKPSSCSLQGRTRPRQPSNKVQEERKNESGSSSSNNQSKWYCLLAFSLLPPRPFVASLPGHSSVEPTPPPRRLAPPSLLLDGGIRRRSRRGQRPRQQPRAKREPSQC